MPMRKTGPIDMKPEPAPAAQPGYDKWSGHRFFIALGALLFLTSLAVLLNGAVLPDGTLFERTPGSVILNETFSNYSSFSHVLDLNGTNNLARWEYSGIISAWMDAGNSTDYGKIDLILEDASGKEVRLPGINDQDYTFKLCKNQTRKTWTDFRLAAGKNFLFW